MLYSFQIAYRSISLDKMCTISKVINVIASKSLIALRNVFFFKVVLFAYEN